MKSSIFLSLSYLRGNQAKKSLSFLSVLSFSGIALGVCALILVTSIMNGFEKALKSTILQMTPHVELLQFNKESSVDVAGAVLALNKYDGINHASSYIRGEGLLGAGDSLQGVLVLGVDEDTAKAGYNLQDKLLNGTIQNDWNVVVGQPLARMLGAEVGDELILLSPNLQSSVLGLRPKLKKVTVGGIYSSGLHSFDSSVVFMDKKSAGRLYGGKIHSGISVWVDDVNESQNIAQELYSDGDYDRFWIEDWSVRNSNLFNAMALERRVMSLILLIIIFLATFNLSISLSQLVNEKKSNIAILRTIGATPTSITLVFFLYGLYLSLIGIMLGLIFGLPLAYYLPQIVEYFEELFSFQILSSEIFIISQVPSIVSLIDVVTITVVSLFLSILFLILPAHRASLIKPTEILKYE